MENNKIPVTIKTFFEIRLGIDPEDVVYSETSIDVPAKNFSTFNLEDYVSAQKEYLSDALNTSPENIRVISRKEYEENTEEEETWTGGLS